MFTVLIHYKIWIDPLHPLLDGYWSNKSEVVEVENLTQLNSMYKHITKIDILLINSTNTTQIPNLNDEA